MLMRFVKYIAIYTNVAILVSTYLGVFRQIY